MIVFIPESHGLGHYFRLLHIAEHIKSAYGRSDIAFVFDAELANSMEFSLVEENDLSSAETVVVDSNNMSFVASVAKRVAGANIIWINDLNKLPEIGPFRKVIAPFALGESTDEIQNGLNYFVVSKCKDKKSVQEVKTIGIYFGSLDETNNLFFTLYRLNESDLLGRYHYNILIGNQYKYKPFIDEYFENGELDGTTFYYSNLNSIYDFLSLNDILISCCNNTSFESMYCGVPVVNVVQNRIQYENASLLDRMYEIPNLGFYPEKEAFVRTFKGEYIGRIDHYSDISKKIVDGGATERIASLIIGGRKC